MRYAEKNGCNKQSLLFLVCTGEGKLHIPGRIKKKVQGKKTLCTQNIRSLFPCKLFFVLPKM